MKKQFLKVVAIVLILALSGATAFAAVPEDVKGQTYEEAVAALVEKGIITGDTDGSFHPDSQLTRAQACIIVVKSMNPPAAEVTGTATQAVQKSSFSDMSGYGWAEGYISYAVKQGVTKGYPDGTFKPGNPVSMNEFITMVLRAADYSDETLGGTWPSNYVNKAVELELLAGLPATLPSYATKWMAAQVDYNALSKIEAANPPAETPGQGTDQDKPSEIPAASNMTYVASGSFNDTMSTYNGKTIAGDVTVYTYGLKKDYSSTMTFSKKIADYRVDTVYKYKNVKTPAFYQLENNKIVAMVVPMNVGFSGRAYGVINGTVTTLNGENESVIGLETLTATREITWLGKKGLSPVPSSAEYLNGTVYEINLSDGEVQSIYKANESYRGDVFEEISGSGADFVEVESYSDSAVKIIAGDGGELFAVKSNASVYVLDGTEYTAGRVSNIRAGVEIRAYDVTDDDDASADIVVIKKN
ncbi:S-layer homology domain-containing protein [Sinanaerobacter chloroacetimidivorans]|uniref:S-layer homology domain-containing protein n=1 Tax=Sinanaerobacter chloroacetimidivorans TaxID=2818044 RepID=A0A8J7W589_9FIRM|nr:S-layer homology domain-containing protein [Sinanaerobacter chloroacetimidivorans]MBR0599195.1 S-layer homology domain-containing protein [Sinanaerobacter chloroacetimidivorans]